MRLAVHSSIAALLLVAVAGAVSPPNGLVQWGERSYRLEPGESTSFRVDFEQIPVRRWWLIVESDRSPCHLNLRRVADGSLVYDRRDEVEHEVAIPWGEDEALSAVIVAGRRGGVFAVGIWGPPRDAYLRSYRYDVNRALEDLAAGDRGAAREHLMAAVTGDPDDPVAAALLQGLNAGTPPLADDDGGGDQDGTVPPRERWAEVRRDVAGLRDGGRFYEAIDRLHVELARPLPRDVRAEVYADLAAVLLDLGSGEQAREAVAAAEELGLDEAWLERLRERLTR
ncbi:hypothetical protein GF314_05915 [bacterium]|nr:hypothetical protein [bacterium]